MKHISVQFSSVAQSCPLLCDPMNRRMPGLPSITISWSSLRLTSIESVIPSSHLILCRPLLLLPPIFPSTRVFFPMSQFFASGKEKYWSFSFSITPSNGYSGPISSPCIPRDSQESSLTPHFKSINSSELSFLYSTALTCIYDYLKNHSFD